MLNRNYTFIKEAKISILSLIVIIILCLIVQNVSMLKGLNGHSSNELDKSLKTSIVFDSGNEVRQDEIIYESIFIMGNANVSLINTTVINSIYMFNTGKLSIKEKSNITVNIIISDSSEVTINNSTVGGSIECRDSSILEILSSNSPLTTIWKFDSANLSITESSLFQLNEFGIGGTISILNSSITNVMLNGVSSSITLIENSNILFLNDLAIPLHYITGPYSLSVLLFSGLYRTSERSINFTWIGWDSPLIDGYLNTNFHIFVDGHLYREINGSGFYQRYIGSLIINFTSTGVHNISLTSIDSIGNNYTSMISIEIISYPSFNWIYFGIGTGVIGLVIVITLIFLRFKQNRRYYSTLGIIFKKELADSKIKTIIFSLIGVAPGIILYFIFGVMNRLLGGIGIDQIRMLVNMILSYYLLYFGIAFSIAFASTGIINTKRNGSLSWFLSKPVRRWEYLWGKILAYLFIIIVVMVATSISFTIGAISYVDAIYIPDILSIGGFVFLIGLLTLIPLTAIGISFSTLFKKAGLAIFLPILIVMILPTLTSFLPILFRHEWPLLFSYSYYFEKLGSFWISNTGGGLSSILSPYSELLGFTITTLEIDPIYIILILLSITIVCFTVSTLYLQKIDIL
ncbi:MAG: ABC transporter permease [Promethearchaeota archaeon]